MYPPDYDDGDRDTCGCGWLHQPGCPDYREPEPELSPAAEAATFIQCMGCGRSTAFSELKATGACRSCSDELLRSDPAFAAFCADYVERWPG